MNKYQRYIFILIILSVCVGIFIEHTEKQSYVIPTNAEVFEDKYYSSREKININTATKEELMTLDGIGEKRSEYITEYRRTNGTFEVVEDIMKIDGIGIKIFDDLKNYITVE